MKVRSEEEGMNGLNIEEMIARYGDEILRLCLLYGLFKLGLNRLNRLNRLCRLFKLRL